MPLLSAATTVSIVTTCSKFSSKVPLPPSSIVVAMFLLKDSRITKRSSKDFTSFLVETVYIHKIFFCFQDEIESCISRYWARDLLWVPGLLHRKTKTLLLFSLYFSCTKSANFIFTFLSSKLSGIHDAFEKKYVYFL